MIQNVKIKRQNLITSQISCNKISDKLLSLIYGFFSYVFSIENKILNIYLVKNFIFVFYFLLVTCLNVKNKIYI
jgi:hypothetical protein